MNAALASMLAAYGRHLLGAPRVLPSFAARIDGPHVVVDIAGRTVRRRAGAYLALVGDVWGDPEPLVATFSDHPSGASSRWHLVDALERDAGWTEGIEALAAAVLAAGARDEAVLMLRRLYAIDERLAAEPECWVGGQHRTPPRTIAADVRRAAIAPGPHATTPQAAVKRVLPFATSTDERERLAAAVRIHGVLPQLTYSNHLGMFKLVNGVLPALLAGEGAVHEVALAIAQNLGMKLLHEQAYPEAKVLLDLVIAEHGALAESLRARWECRLYLDDDGAEEDWDRAARLSRLDEPSSVGRCMFWSGDVVDRRRVALARVAKALVLRADGKDACKDRKVTKKDLPDAAAIARLLARAASLSGDAVDTGAPRVEADLACARTEVAVMARGFSAEEYAARGTVREATGDLAGAVADYEAARELRVAGGISYQFDHFGEDVRRARSGGPTMPCAFDPVWLGAKGRTAKERAAAVTTWATLTAWRTFPETPASPTHVPIAPVLLRDVVAHGASLWKLAAADGVDLGDRLAFARRAFVVLDRWLDRRDADWLADVFEHAHEVAFFGDRGNLDARTKAERAPLLAWLAALVAAPALDEAAVVARLGPEPWSRLADRFEAKRSERWDPLRTLFAMLAEAKLDAETIATVIAAYLDLWRNDWSTLGTPRNAAKGWAKHGDALAKLDAKQVAPVLVAWTRLLRGDGRAHASAVDAKWLWPFKSLAGGEALVAEVGKGTLDRKPPTKGQKTARAECLAWLG